MTMRVTRDEFAGEGSSFRSVEEIAKKMALDFEASVFLRMRELGIRQKDLAGMLGVSPAAVSKMLSGGSNLTLRSMAKVAFVLGCDVSPIGLVKRDGCAGGADALVGDKEVALRA